MSLDAMKQALEALNDCTYDEEGYCLNPDNVDAILALRAAIEQAQELVCVCGAIWEGQELVSAPLQRKPLTDDEISSLWDGHIVPVFGKNGINPIVFARAIEAKLREKNT